MVGRKPIDLTNRKFGFLTALYPLSIREPTNGCVKWMCYCECGNYHVVNSNNLQREGGIKSCGCSKLKRRKTWYNKI